MNYRYPLIIFDWEGTLADTQGQVTGVIRNALEHMDHADIDIPCCIQSLACGLVMAVGKSMPRASSVRQKQVITALEYALRTRSLQPCLFTGAADVIKRLHAAGIILAIATNKGSQSLQSALQKTALASYFTVTRSAGQTLAKPHPQMLQEILDITHCRPGDALMVGDSVCDMEMAACANIDSLGMDFYNEQSNSLRVAGARWVVHDYEALAQIVLQDASNMP